MSSQDYNKLTVSQLRSALSERDLEVTGKKSELIERLKENDQEKLRADEAEQDEGLEVEEEEVEEEEAEPEAEEEAEEEAEVEAEAETEEEPKPEPEAETDAKEEEAAEENGAEENGAGEKMETAETTETKTEDEEMKEEEEHPLDSGEFVMLDEAGDDELEDVNEDELLGEDDIAAAEKAEEEEDDVIIEKVKEGKQSKQSKPDAIVIEDDEEDEDGEDSDRKSGKRSSRKSSRDTKKEEKLHVVDGGISEEDLKALRVEFEKREAEEKAKADRLHEKRYIFRIFKHMCLKYMEDGVFSKSIVIKKFRPEFFGNEALQEGLKAADMVNIHTEADKPGYCELVIKNNKLNKEIRNKVKEALPDCEVTIAAKSFFKEMVDVAENRNKKDPDFTDKYRECMLLATLEISGDEQLQEMSPADIEDEVATFFPDAVSITVPDNCDESNNFRFILVELPSIKLAEEKLLKVREEKPVIAGKKLEFSVYQRKWLDEKFRMRREGTQKKDPMRDVARAFRDLPILTEEERHECRMRIEKIYKSLKPYKKDDLYHQILSDEKTLMREKLRQDDRKRADKKLPVLQWNADTMKEEVKEEKKKDEEKKEGHDSDKDKKDSKDKKSDDRRRSRSRQGSSKRGRSSSRDRSASRSKHARTDSRRRSSRSPPARPRRGGNTGGRWQDNRGNNNAGKQGSIMGQPPNQQNKFQQMRGGGMQQQQQGGRMGGNQRMNVNNRGGRGGHMGRGGMANMQMNMMNNQAMMAAQPNMNMMQQQQMAMQGMNNPMMAGMPIQQAAMNANPADSSASSNPVQLLLGLSKVLSNQIKQMSATDQPGAAAGRDYRDNRGAAGQDNYYRGAGDNRSGGRGSQTYANNRQGGAGGGYYRS